MIDANISYVFYQLILTAIKIIYVLEHLLHLINDIKVV